MEPTTHAQPFKLVMGKVLARVSAEGRSAGMAWSTIVYST
jgi:hypothetical protein